MDLKTLVVVLSVLGCVLGLDNGLALTPGMVFIFFEKWVLLGRVGF